MGTDFLPYANRTLEAYQYRVDAQEIKSPHIYISSDVR